MHIDQWFLTFNAWWTSKIMNGLHRPPIHYLKKPYKVANYDKLIHFNGVHGPLDSVHGTPVRNL